MSRFLQRIPTRADWILPLALAFLSLIGSGYAAYNHNDKEMNARVTALETGRTDDQQKIDHIQTQVDKLVEWALGHK